MASRGISLGGGGGTGGGDAQLSARRAQVDKGLADQLARILAADTEVGDLMGARARGEDSPFGDAGRYALRADVADSTGAQLSGEQRRIRRAFASALAGGVSGGQVSAEAGAARRAAAQNRQGMRDVDVRTRVEDFGAKERGQQSLAGFRGQQAQLAADRLAQLIAFNSRFEVTGQSPYAGAFGGGGGGRPGGAGDSSFPSGSGGAVDAAGNLITSNQSFGPEGAYPATPLQRKPAQGLVGSGMAGNAGAAMQDEYSRLLGIANFVQGGLDPARPGSMTMTGSAGSYSGSPETLLANVYRNRDETRPMRDEYSRLLGIANSVQGGSSTSGSAPLNPIAPATQAQQIGHAVEHRARRAQQGAVNWNAR